MEGWNSVKAGESPSTAATRNGALELSEPTTGHGHVVHFYDDDSSLIGAVTGFLGARLAARGAAVVIATDEHSQALRRSLSEAGIDVAAAESRGRYVELDADETLALFADEEGLDPDRFADVIGAALDRVSLAGQPVAAFGEMVSILWGAGKPEQAVELERLWDRLAKTRAFALFCGYRQALFEDDAAGEGSICDCHDLTVPPPVPPVIDEREASRRLEPTLFAAPATRRFVTSTLAAWNLTSISDPLELAASEMATNAILHARGRFLVKLEKFADRVRLSIVDSSASMDSATPEMSDESSTGGRGIPLVDALASRWGFELRDNGKTVWAEMDLPESTTA